MRQLVACNQCEEAFEPPKHKREVHKHLVYEFYFHCPHCNHKYVSYYTNKKMRQEINRQKKRWKKYQQPSTESAERKFRAQIDMNDRLIKKDMDQLYEQMQEE